MTQENWRPDAIISARRSSERLDVVSLDLFAMQQPMTQFVCFSLEA